jgi:hypothetical protein
VTPRGLAAAPGSLVGACADCCAQRPVAPTRLPPRTTSPAVAWRRTGRPDRRPSTRRPPPWTLGGRPVAQTGAPPRAAIPADAWRPTGRAADPSTGAPPRAAIPADAWRPAGRANCRQRLAANRRDGPCTAGSLPGATSVTRLPCHYWLAQAYVGLGDHDAAFAALERSLPHAGFLGNLPVEPLMDPLRGDPRYDRVIVGLRLPGRI